MEVVFEVGHTYLPCFIMCLYCILKQNMFYKKHLKTLVVKMCQFHEMIIRCLLRFFYNVPHQTTQNLNLMDRFRGNEKFFDTLPTRNNYTKLKQNFSVF